MPGTRWAAGNTPLYSAMADTAKLDDGSDGDTSTYESATDPTGLTGVYVAGTIDLGAAMAVDEIRITGYASVAGGYDLWYSLDDVTYTPIHDDFPGWFGSQQNIWTFGPISARYIRGSIVDQDTGDGPVEARISDLRLFSSGSPVTPPDDDCPVPPKPDPFRAVPGFSGGGVGQVTILGNQ